MPFTPSSCRILQTFAPSSLKIAHGTQVDSPRISSTASPCIGPMLLGLRDGSVLPLVLAEDFSKVGHKIDTTANKFACFEGQLHKTRLYPEADDKCD